MNDFGVIGFTSGCVCVQPARSMAMLKALKDNDLESAERIRQEFRPLEDLRNAHGPIPVLHHAVALASIANTGPHLPMLSALDDSVLGPIETAAKALL